MKKFRFIVSWAVSAGLAGGALPAASSAPGAESLLQRQQLEQATAARQFDLELNRRQTERRILPVQPSARQLQKFRQDQALQRLRQSDLLQQQLRQPATTSAPALQRQQRAQEFDLRFAPEPLPPPELR